MKSVLSVWCTLLLTIVAVQGKTAEEWKSRVIYQILTDRFACDSSTPSSTSCSDLRQYCGGTFKGIKAKLDYIQGLGVNAIWISPIPQQTDIPYHGYHGYWQQDLYNINLHYGTEKDLKELIDACHERDIWVMLDVVANHMGMQHDGDWDNFASFVPFDKPEHYHPYCYIHNYDNHHEVEKCRLANLPDLDESNSFVRSTLISWVHNIVAKYGFDGIRVDTIPEVSKDFWFEYCKSAGVFSIGEAFSGDIHYVASYQGHLDSTLNYPMFYKLNNAFLKKETMRNLHDGAVQNAIFPDASILGLFLDNHDNPRFLHINRDWALLKNALAYIIFAEGIPIIYYGTEQGLKGGHDPDNRECLWPHHDTNHHLYQFISTIVKLRVQKGASLYQAKQVERYVDDQFFAFTRAEVFVAVTNIGSGHSLWRTITYHPYSTGTKLVNILDRSDCVTVNNGRFDVNIRNGQPKVYTPASEADCTATGKEASCLPDSPREDCGHDGITEKQCLDRGCCWDPKNNVAWCFYKTSLQSQCLVSGPRSDCGHLGIDKEECEAQGCCWHPMKNIPWCFHPLPEADSAAPKEEL